MLSHGVQWALSEDNCNDAPVWLPTECSGLQVSTDHRGGVCTSLVSACQSAVRLARLGCGMCDADRRRAASHLGSVLLTGVVDGTWTLDPLEGSVSSQPRRMFETVRAGTMLATADRMVQDTEALLLGCAVVAVLMVDASACTMTTVMRGGVGGGKYMLSL